MEINYGFHLIELGYDPNLWQDESSPQSIIDSWNNNLLLCPFNSIDDLILACISVEATVNEKFKNICKKSLLKELVDDETLHYYRHFANNELDKAEEAKIVLNEAISEVEKIIENL